MEENQDDKRRVDDFMARVGIGDAEYTKLATFLAIMVRETNLGIRAKDLGVTRPDLEKYRSHVFDLMLDISKAIDQEAEESGETDYTITEDGVGVFSHEKLTRAATLVLEGIPRKEVEARFGFKAGAADVLAALFERRLLYMGAEAIKANPTWTALDVIKSLSNPEEFAEWNDRAIVHIDEEEAANEAENFEGEDEIE